VYLDTKAFEQDRTVWNVGDFRVRGRFGTGWLCSNWLESELITHARTSVVGWTVWTMSWNVIWV
jgi:hypothetical protein